MRKRSGGDVCRIARLGTHAIDSFPAFTEYLTSPLRCKGRAYLTLVTDAIIVWMGELLTADLSYECLYGVGENSPVWDST